MSGKENEQAVQSAEQTPKVVERQPEVKKEEKPAEVSVSAGEKATVEAVQAVAAEKPKLTLRVGSRTPFVISVEDFYGFWVESEGRGVGDALVTLAGAAIGADKTSSSGYVSFKIKPINPGDVTITATKDGFEHATLTLQVNPVPTEPKITATKEGYEDATFMIAVPEPEPQTFVRPRRSFLDEIKPVKVSEEPVHPKPRPKPKGPSITDVLFGWAKKKYFCPRCKQQIAKDTPQCPNCGETIDWKGVA